MTLPDKDNDNRYLCDLCVGADRFTEWIKKNGAEGECDFSEDHDEPTAVVSVKEFAVAVDEFFRQHYTLGRELPHVADDSDKIYYDAEGQPYKEILAEELQCDEDLVEAISEHLPDADDRDIMQGGETFYDDMSNYEPISAAESRARADEEDYWYSQRFSLQWVEFCKEVQYRRRYFGTRQLLDSLFGKPTEYQEGPVKPIYDLKAGAKIYRSRLLDDNFDEKRLAQNPAAELSAPPKRFASAGRMNVEYIPAFYGAFSDVTATAELRPGIDDRLASGEFVLQKALRVFDFTVFDKLSADKIDQAIDHTRYEFITQMESEISKPILSYDKQREYIATQIVAEYLREYFDCDAIIYRSSMHKDDKADNRNIVIFDKAGEFIQAGGSLKLASHRVVRVHDVKYKVAEDLF